MEELLMSLESGITRLNAAREKLADSKARERLTKLFDEGTFTELDAFNDSAEVIIGYGIIEGAPAYAFAQDINCLLYTSRICLSISSVISGLFARNIFALSLPWPILVSL